MFFNPSTVRPETHPAAHAAAAEPQRDLPAIQLEDVSKCYQLYDHPRDRLKQALFRGHRTFYREFWALRGISLDVPRAQTLGVIGRNGSGKSTLLQIICGTLAPTAGTTHINGRIAALLELGAGFHPEFTGRENVFLNARILGLSRAQTEARFDQIAAFADIGPFLDQPVKTYSSGMAVRLAFAVIAHVDADILVIDEALAVGDAFFQQKCMRFLRQFRESGTIVFASHDAAAVLSLCDRVLWLDAGEARQIGPAKALNEAYLAALFADMGRQRSGLTAPEESSAEGGRQPLPPSPQGTPVIPLRDGCESFGDGGAVILGVDIVDDQGRPIQVAEAGARVTVRISFRAVQPLARPIAGFYLKDRLGQNLFGQNTALTYRDDPPAMAAGEERLARFCFAMPTLQAGAYTLAAAIADGTLHQHVQHHWVHDAYLLTASGQDAIATGLVGIPVHVEEFCRTSPGARGGERDGHGPG